MKKTWPKDCIQGLCPDSWWTDTGDEHEVCCGRLIWATLPHVDQEPRVLVAKGRKEPREHGKAYFEVKSFREAKNWKRDHLPVAGVTAIDGEHFFLMRAKKRPAVVIGNCENTVPKNLRTKGLKWHTSKTFLVAPYYSVSSRSGSAAWQKELVRFIRYGTYPQFMWDRLPVNSDDAGSILRLDHVQPVGDMVGTYKATRFKLSDEAIEVIEDWLMWFRRGQIVENGSLHLFKQILAE